MSSVMWCMLYYNPGSAPSRLVLLVAAALQLQLELVDVTKEPAEEINAAIMSLNPLGTVPILVDAEFSVCEARAISRYLISKYGGVPGDSLYPAEPQARAIIDQRLDFDLGTLYPTFGYYYISLFQSYVPFEEWRQKLYLALDYLETFLAKSEFAAGPILTLADLSLVSTVSTIEAVGISLNEYPNVVRWFILVKNTAPAYNETNGRGIKVFKEVINNITHKHEF